MQQPEFGERLRELRKARSLTQRDLAGGFVTPSYISLVEAGRRVPTLDVVVRLAKILDVPLSDLLDEELVPLRTREQTSISLFLTEVLARDSMDLDDYENAAANLQAALRAARDADQPMRMVELGMRLQDALAAMNEHGARIELLQELLDLPSTRAFAELQVILRSDLAGALRDASRLAEAQEAVSLALKQIRDSALNETTQHVKLLGVAVSVLVESDLKEELPVHVEELLRLAVQVGGPRVQGRAHWVASRAYAEMGDSLVAEEQLAQAQRKLASPMMPLRDWLRFCRSSASVLLDIGTDLEQARSWLENADTAARTLGMTVEHDRVKALWARYEFAAGNPERCLQILEAVMEDPDVLQEPPGAVLDLWLLQARALGLLGRSQEAEVLLRRLATEAESLGEYERAVRVWRELDQLRGQRDSV